MDILAKLFGSPSRVKVMRLFLLNPESIFENENIRKRSRVNADSLRKELTLLEKVNFIKRVKHTKEVVKKLKTKEKSQKKRADGWQLDPDFVYLHQIRDLLVNSTSLSKDEVATKFSRAGKVKLVIVSGVFLNRDDSRVDLLVVGDRLRKNIIERELEVLQSEIGKELSYSFFETNDYLYRLGIYDKFIRDILDYPHEKLVDKLG